MSKMNTLLGQEALQKRIIRRADQTQCASQALYTTPSAGQVINSANNTVIEWDKSCLETGTDKIDIYLYAPGSEKANLPIHAWVGVPANKGSYEVKLAPKWWNVTASTSSTTSLSLNIVKAGNEPWDSANPFGPAWSASYTAPTNGADPPADAVAGSDKSSKIITAFYEAGSLTAGGKAAAIVCPLIVVLVALGVWIRKLHINRNNKTADWADHMDKRMSRISMDWMSGGDGSAGPVPGSRPASYYPRPSQQQARPSNTFGRAGAGAGDTRSIVSTANNFAGRGVGAARAFHGVDNVEPEFVDETEMTEPRRPRGQSMYNEGDRQSRISFAGNTQGDRVSRISFAPSSNDHGSRGGHKNSASIPRVGQGARRSQYGNDEDAPAVPRIDPSYRNRDSAAYADGMYDEGIEDIMSPDQERGAMPLGAHDVHERMRGDGTHSSASDANDHELRNSMMDYPAVSMINDGQDGQMHSRNGSLSMTTGMAPPANGASPDDALRAYAAQRGDTPAQGNSSAMRTLYTPQPGLGHRSQASIHKSQASINTAGSSINEDDVVGYREANML
ncbi:unnamed protein product [Sympodiomycopsis kandeliae]